jgi:asparagine synthase (glutamine-hydrolysing)
MASLWKIIPQSRSNALSNKARQLTKFADGMKLNPKERYWRWASFANETESKNLLSQDSQNKISEQHYQQSKAEILEAIGSAGCLNEILRTDTTLVLPNDMLTKVDLMSMANGLEVRTPFLDFEVVNFIFALPENFKINSSIRKRILQDAFRDILPVQLYNRPKKGFEVPLLKWFRKEMKSMIVDDLLSKKLIEEQGIFNYPEINKLKDQLFSSNPGDVHARIWGLIVFQFWWKKHIKQ